MRKDLNLPPQTLTGLEVVSIGGGNTTTTYNIALLATSSASNLPSAVNLINAIVPVSQNGISYQAPSTYFANIPIAAIAAGTNTYTVTIPGISSYIYGQQIVFQVLNANTGASTINVNGLGAISLVKNVSTPLAGAEMSSNQIVSAFYDNTNFQVQVLSFSGGGGWPLGGTGTLTSNVSMIQAGFNTTFSGIGTVTFSPTSTQAGLNVGSYAGIPGTWNNGDFNYNTLTKTLQSKIAGNTSSLYANARVYNVKDYGAKGDGVQTSANGTINNTSTNFTLSTGVFTVADIGKTIEIPGAGVAGAVLVTTITAVGSTTSITVNTAASTSVTTSRCWYGTDDTAAIQNCINAIYAAGGGAVFFPNGIYIIAGPMITSDNNGLNPNSQLYIPVATYSASQTNYMLIKLIGESSQSFANFDYTQINGTVLKSTTNQGTGSFPSIIGSAFASTYTYNFNYTEANFENLVIAVSSNGGATATNMLAVNGLRLAKLGGKRVNTTIDVKPSITTLPTPLGTGSAGWAISAANNNGPNIFQECTSLGFEHGYIAGEHTYFQGCYSQWNYNGLTISPGNGYSIIGSLYLGECTYGIARPNGALMGISAYNNGQPIELVCDFEFLSVGPVWSNHVALFNDPGFFLTGNLSYKNNAALFSENNTTLGAGATHVMVHQRAAAFPITYRTDGLPYTLTESSLTSLNTNNLGIFELNTGRTSLDGFQFSTRLVQTTNQTITTAGLIGSLIWSNSAIAGANKKLVQIDISCNGATNTAQWDEYIMNAGTQTHTGVKFTNTQSILQNTLFGNATTTPSALVHLTQPALSSTWLPALRVDAGAHTAMTASTEFAGTFSKVSAVTQTWANGAFALQRFNYWDAPTIAFASGSNTVTDVYNGYFNDPIAGAFAVITNKWSLGTQGSFKIGGSLVTIGTASKIAGTATNDSAASGIIGEEIISNQSTYTNYTTTATYQQIVTISLTAGDWDITAAGTFSGNSATLTTTANAIFLVGTVTASATGAVEGQSLLYIDQNIVGASKQSITIGPFRVSIASTTSYFLNTQSTFTVGNPQFVGFIRARRIR